MARMTKQERVEILMGIGFDFTQNYFALPQWRLDILNKAMEDDQYKYRNANCTRRQCYYFSLQRAFERRKKL